MEDGTESGSVDSRGGDEEVAGIDETQDSTLEDRCPGGSTDEGTADSSDDCSGDDSDSSSSDDGSEDGSDSGSSDDVSCSSNSVHSAEDFL